MIYLYVSLRVLKETCVKVADVLTFIFNQLSLALVPADCQVANILKAQHEKGPKELPESYHPISLTTMFSSIQTLVRLQ